MRFLLKKLGNSRWLSCCWCEILSSRGTSHAVFHDHEGKVPLKSSFSNQCHTWKSHTEVAVQLETVTNPTMYCHQVWKRNRGKKFLLIKTSCKYCQFICWDSVNWHLLKSAIILFHCTISLIKLKHGQLKCYEMKG